MPKFKEFYLPHGVDPIPGEPLRFNVASRSGEQPWLVDLEECGFNGACGCPDFQIHHLSKLREDRREGRKPVKRRCWHIKQALYWKAEVSVRQDALRFYGARMPIKKGKNAGT